MPKKSSERSKSKKSSSQVYGEVLPIGKGPTTGETTPVRKHKPAGTPDAREKQLISYAMDLAEEQLRDGTASPSVITHFLKLGSMREEVERKLLENQTTLVSAKAEAIKQDKQTEQLTEQAINAMKSYGPSTADDHD